MFWKTSESVVPFWRWKQNVFNVNSMQNWALASAYYTFLYNLYNFYKSAGFIESVYLCGDAGMETVSVVSAVLQGRRTAEVKDRRLKNTT